MTSHISTIEADQISNGSNDVLRVLGESIDAAAESGKSLLSSVDAPQFNTIYDFTVTRVIYHKDGNPFLLKGYIGVGSNNIAGTVHVSGIVGDTKADRDCRFNHEIGVGDQLAVEILEKSSEGYRFSERLAAERQELDFLMQQSKLTAVVLDDANEDSESVFVVINNKHKARLHASALKDSSRDLRDARIKSLRKDETLELTIKSFARHPKFPVFQISCQEFGKQERKPVAFSKPARLHTKSPLGNKTGDRAAAEAKRNERRLRDQTQRNKMKTAGGGKKN